jgi:hypothetical protein
VGICARFLFGNIRNEVMFMVILIAVLITFGVTAVWQLLATKKIRANHRIMIQGIIKEMNEMAVKLGHEGFLEYLAATKGKGYATTAGVNLKSFYDSFSDSGADSEILKKHKDSDDPEDIRYHYILKALSKIDKKDRGK